MPPINFDAIPSGVNLSSENIQRISDRTAETAAAYARKLEKLQATFSEARERFSRDAQALVGSANRETRSAAFKLSKQREAQQISDLRRSLVASSQGERDQLLNALQGYANEAAFLASLCASSDDARAHRRERSEADPVSGTA